MKRTSAGVVLGACTLTVIIGWGGRTFAAPSKVAKPTVDLSIYRHVSEVGWVVKDLDRVVDYWENLGLKNIQRTGIQELPDIVYRGKITPLSVKVASGNIGGVTIEWIQPVKGGGVYTEFLQKHGDGVHHLAFLVRSPQKLEEQIQYFKAKGVGLVQDGTWQATRSKGRFVYLDTGPKGGGLTFELMYDPDAPPAGTVTNSQNEYPFSKIVQYAILVRDVKKVSSFYEGLGFGGMPVDHNVSVNRNYRGQPGKFEMYLGWWHWGDVTFEWIQPLVGPSVYDEYLKAHGEGFHHLAFEVTDMDQAVELLKAKRAPVSQSGGWESPDSKGRFAYVDTEPYGGVTIELLWNQP